jgi:hypothetical protein
MVGHWTDSWMFLLLSLEEPGQPADSGRLKDPDEWQIDPQTVPDAGHQPGGQQGVPAQEKKVFIQAHGLSLQKALPEVLESGVDVVRRSGRRSGFSRDLVPPDAYRA